jgi:hypothetical protein
VKLAKTRLNIRNTNRVKTRILEEFGTTFREEMAEINKEVKDISPAAGTFKLGRNTASAQGDSGRNFVSESSMEKFGPIITECNLAGMSLTKTAKAAGASINVVHAISKALGLKWDGRISEYNALTLRRQNEVRKQRIKTDLLAATEKFVRRMLDPTYTMVAVGSSRIMVEEVPVIPGGEARDLSTAARNLMFVVERLEAFEREKERNETSTIDDWLRAMTGENEWNSYSDNVNRKILPPELEEG